MGENCKEEALAIEDTINKGHSGLDFAAIWEERPIVIQGNKYEFTELPKGLQRGLLVDTGLPAAPTSIIVQRLKDRLTREKVLMDSIEDNRQLHGAIVVRRRPSDRISRSLQRTRGSRSCAPPSTITYRKDSTSGGAAKPGRFGGQLAE